MRRLFGMILMALGLALATPAMAQDQASLIANSLQITGDTTLIADGAVEVFYKGSHLKASRLTYDRAADSLTIEGPITLTDGTGVVILASQAELRADLTEGILRSARVVMNQQLQLAAAEVMRIGGRYTAMTRVVASSCKICADNPTPLWEIRARRVVHDQTERQIYFDQASLRLAGFPVAYIPRLRMPDPTLKRTTGFLMPTLHSSSTLGTGAKVPYFLTLGAHRDLTMTPYVTTKGVRTLELRYRQAFRTGTIELSAIGSRDDLLPGVTRGLLTADGSFALPKGFNLTFHGETVSDRAYLLDYGLSAKDRLDSRVELSRTRRNEHISARLIGFQSLRVGEDNRTLATAVGDLTWQRRFALGPLGGQGGLRFQAHSHGRASTDPLDTNLDGIADGRDVARAQIRADWRRDWTAGNGMIFGVLGEVATDLYAIGDDATFGGGHSRTHGAVAAELRWPLVKAGKAGVSHVMEPVVQVVWAPSKTTTLPNEDSVLVEFDEGNLFALNRFPGTDAVERGARLNIGLNYLRLDPTGWSLGATVGRVIRADDLGQFTDGSGLDGVSSDWLAAWQFQNAEGLTVTNRLLADDTLKLTKAELLLTVQKPRYGLDAGYLYHKADPAEGRVLPTKELVFDGRVAMGQAGWEAQLTNRYDVVAKRAANAGLGLTFRNECLAVDLSLSRRFTSSTSVKPTTSFSVSLELLGFGGSSPSGASRQCGG